MACLNGSPWVAPEGRKEPDPEPALAEAACSVAKGEKERGRVTLLGGHLFESLLGAVAWEQIKQTARENGTRKVELALSWPPGETRLHVPAWEAMHDGSEFLAGHHELTVAITRVLPTREGDDGERAPVPSLMAPARVLFVIGSAARDPKIRAGMEVLGLLRGAERGPAGIDAKILESANVDDLEQACARFKPHIVHFVSHGRVSESEQGQLLLRGEKKEEDDWVGADRLLTALRSDGHAPTVAVLTGCLSAASGGHVDPLAAELVKRGIPVVLGMAGRISDRVCRLFLRRFGVALSQGEPLVDALTAGRRAGLQQQVAAAADDPAWALPSIYLDADVEAGLSLVDVGEASPVVARVREYKLDLEPVFCGRLEYIQLFDELLDEDRELNNLVVYTGLQEAEKLGKTRLLHEFAGRALRRGHLVVWIDDRGEDISLLPRSYSQLAVEMLAAIHEARERFDLDVPAKSRLVGELSRVSEFELDLTGADSPRSRRDLLGAFVFECREGKEEIDGSRIAGALKGALAEDLTMLAAEARRRHPDTFGADHCVVAMFGSIGKWGEVTDLVCRTLLDVYGLGTAAEPVPVFATAAMADAPEVLERGLDRARSSEGTRYEELGRLHGVEEILSYQTVLLLPSKLRLGKRKPLSPYVPNYDKQTEPSWEDELKDLLEGVPGHFRERLLIVAPLLARDKTLLEADEEDVMRNYLEAEGLG
jgi:hypothetical protein